MTRTELIEKLWEFFSHCSYQIPPNALSMDDVTWTDAAVTKPTQSELEAM